MTEPLAIPERFCGFTEIAHGGYVSGLLAAGLGDSAEVVLRGRVPMDTPLELTRPSPDRALLSDGDRTLAEAMPVELELDLPEPVTFAEAQEASRSYPGFSAHLFPRCFGCGPRREPGDGLRLFPGRVEGREMVAAPWVPDPAFADDDGNVRAEFAWAAVDCPQLWGLILAAPTGSSDRVVTSRLAVTLNGAPRAGEPYAVIAWPIEHRCREHTVGAAVISNAGEPLVVARQTAVVVDWGVPLGLDGWSSR